MTNHTHLIVVPNDAAVLARAIDGCAIDFLVLCSSLGSLLGQLVSVLLVLLSVTLLVALIGAGGVSVGIACTAGRTFSANSRRLFSALARGIPP